MYKILIYSCFLFININLTVGQVTLKKTIDTTIEASLFHWRLDSNGCFYLRDWKIAKQIITEYKLLNKDISYCLFILGKPNLIYVDELKITHVVYSLSSICKSGKIIEGGILHSLDLYFDESFNLIQYEIESE